MLLRGDTKGALAQYAMAYDLEVPAEGEKAVAMAMRALRGMALTSESSGDLAAAQGCYEKLLARAAGDTQARANLVAIVRRQSTAP